MRIPNLNVSQSVTQKIRDLDLERFKLDKQITTGQKLSLPEDGGLTMSRVIQLDSTKSKLAQYQRNSSYATEFINAGHLNLEKLLMNSLGHHRSITKQDTEILVKTHTYKVKGAKFKKCC